MCQAPRLRRRAAPVLRRRHGRLDSTGRSRRTTSVSPDKYKVHGIKRLATHIKSKCLHEWDENINKLHEIESSVGKTPQIHAGGRRDQAAAMLATHSLHMLKGDGPSLECIGCQSPLTSKHILLDCVDFLTDPLSTILLCRQYA